MLGMNDCAQKVNSPIFDNPKRDYVMRIYLILQFVFAMTLNATQPADYVRKTGEVNIQDGTWIRVSVSRRGVISAKVAQESFSQLGKVVAMDWSPDRLKQLVQFATTEEAKKVVQKGQLLVDGLSINLSRKMPVDLNPSRIRMKRVFDFNHDPLIYQHVRAGQLEKVHALLNEDKALINGHDARGGSLLRNAAFEGHVEIAALLLELGANLEDADHVGWAPLHAAASRGHVQMVRFLLNKGARVDVSDNSGRTPLILAAHNGHEEIVGDLLRNKADVNRQTIDGRTALMFAANASRLAVVRQLLEAGALTELCNQKNKTALEQVKQLGDPEIIALLSQCAIKSIQGNEQRVETYQPGTGDVWHRDSALTASNLVASSIQETEEAEEYTEEDRLHLEGLVNYVLSDEE